MDTLADDRYFELGYLGQCFSVGLIFSGVIVMGVGNSIICQMSMVIRHGGNKARLKGSLATFDKSNRDALTYNNHLVIDDWENTHLRYFIFAKNGFF